MKKVRFGVFETNSSSTHTLTIVPKRHFQAWKRGELFFNKENDKLESEEALENYFNKEVDKRYCETFEDYKEEYLETYEKWYNDYGLETYVEDYTTEGGEELVVFGKYGRD